MQKKFLILTGSFGSGHNSAANAIRETILEKYPESKVEIFDFVTFFNQTVGNLSKKLHEEMALKFPKIWSMAFDMFDDKIMTRSLYGMKNPIFQNKFDEKIKEFQPDYVISAYFLWQGFVKHNIKKFGKPYKTATIITDAINIHSIWYLRKDYIDFYFVIDEYSKKFFEEKFQPQTSRVLVSFFPINRKYFIDKTKIGNKNIVILLSYINDEFLANFFELFKDQSFNITVLKGANKEGFEKYKEKYSQYSVFNFVEFINLKENFENIDIMISKSGGAITCECIATDTPLIVPDFIPGQEEGNIKLLNYTETGFYEPNVENILFALKYVDWNRLLPNFKKSKNYDSCKFIIDKIME